MFNTQKNTLERKEAMNEARSSHGLSKRDQKIFAFGGYDGSNPMKSAEVYDVVKNSWKKLPDMPEEGFQITCVRVQNQIFITSVQFRLVSYDIRNEAYSYVGEQSKGLCCVASSKDKVYLFEREQIFEMNKQCEVLDTITIDRHINWCITSSTHPDGTIFLLQNDGKVLCYDPIGEKQLKEIQDLNQD